MRRCSTILLFAWVISMFATTSCDPSPAIGPGPDAMVEPFCGDGLEHWPERCDDGAANTDTDPRACQTDCTTCDCSELVECTYAGDTFECTACPAGYVEVRGETYQVHCLPALLDLVVVGATLDRPFDPAIRAYTVTVDDSVTSIAFTPSANPELSLEVEDVPIASGQTSASFDIRFGTNPFHIDVGTSRYVVLVQRSMAISYLKASNTDAGDHFGTAVAVDGDTLAVGAPIEQSGSVGIDGDQGNGGVNRGAVYVFHRVGATWSQQAYVKPSDESVEYFGTQVELDGDTLVARGTRTFVFQRTGATWAEQAVIGPAGAGEVALSGDTIAMAYQGSLRIYRRTSDLWTEEATLTNLDVPRDYQLIADGVKLDGDLLATTVERCVLDNFGSCIYDEQTLLFRRTQTSWQAAGSPPASGRVAAIDGDRIVIVRPASPTASQVCVHRWDGAVWIDEGCVNAATPQGTSVDAVIDGDRLAVSAGDLPGAIRTYVHDGSMWRPQAYLRHHDVLSEDSFGRSLAISGDLLVGGAYDEDSAASGVDGDQFDTSAPNSGAVYALTVP